MRPSRCADPGMCTTSLSLFNCRQLGPDALQNRLVVDATVPCTGAWYTAHAALSTAIGVGLALVPLRFCWAMTHAADAEDENDEQSVARLVSEEHHVREQFVLELMHEIVRNNHFSFLTAGACCPKNVVTSAGLA